MILLSVRASRLSKLQGVGFRIGAQMSRVWGVGFKVQGLSMWWVAGLWTTRNLQVVFLEFRMFAIGGMCLN